MRRAGQDGYKESDGKDSGYTSLAETKPRQKSRAGHTLLHRTMKLLLLALSVALLFTAGEALTCNRCIPKVAGEGCEMTEEVCKPGKDACAAVKFLSSPYGQYQKCMRMSDCDMLKTNSFINIRCCTDDLCNTFENAA